MHVKYIKGNPKKRKENIDILTYFDATSVFGGIPPQIRKFLFFFNFYSTFFQLSKKLLFIFFQVSLIFPKRLLCFSLAFPTVYAILLLIDGAMRPLSFIQAQKPVPTDETIQGAIKKCEDTTF